jgi:hypothetical protein
LTPALEVTAPLWPPLLHAYAWVHRAAHLLANHDGLRGEQGRVQYPGLLDDRGAQKANRGALGETVDHFRQVTASFAPGLCHCDDVPDPPRTNSAADQS